MDFCMEQFFAVPLIWGNKNGDLGYRFHHIHLNFLVTLKEGVCAESLGRKKVLFKAFNAAVKAAKTRRSRERTASKKINDVQFKQFLQWANEPEQGLQVKDLDQFINFRKLEKLVQCTLPASYKHFDKMMWVVLESFAQIESVSKCADVLSFLVDMFYYPLGIDCAKRGQPELVPIVCLNQLIE